MKFRREWLLLGLIFVAGLAARLFVAFGSDNFTYDAYFNIRQVEVLVEHLSPNFEDPNYYAPHPFLPLFHYVLAAFLVFLPLDFVFKAIPNFIAATSIIFSYLLSYELTKDKDAALFSALSAAFIPVYIFKTATSVSEYALVVPLTLFLVYLFIRLGKIDVLLFVAALFALVLSHPSSLIFVSGLVLYTVLMFALRSKPTKAELEVIFLSLISSLWIIFLFFKRPLLSHGLSSVWGNAPERLVEAQFRQLNFLEAIYGIGILTFIGGTYILYKSVFSDKRKDVHVLISLSLLILGLMWLKLIAIDTGVMFLGVYFAVMSGEAAKGFLEYAKKTHMAKNSVFVAILLIFGFLASSAIPSLFYEGKAYYDEPSSYEIEAFRWLSHEDGQTVFADLKEGPLVAALSNKKNFVDTYFLTASDLPIRLADMETIYSTKSQIQAIELLDEYSISHLVITRRALEQRNLTGIRYYSSDCFEPVFENRDVRVYRSLCKVSS